MEFKRFASKHLRDNIKRDSEAGIRLLQKRWQESFSSLVLL